MSNTEMIERVKIQAKNIGGISETEVDIPPGVAVLTGRNATNRTSFLQTIMAVLGSNDVTLKGDANEGSVELSLGDETYHRTLHDRNGAISFAGDPYLDDATIADLFAFLLESNEARRAVVQGNDLRELIMRPVDTEEIQAEIERLKRKRSKVDEQLEEIDSLKNDLPSLEKRKSKLEAEIEDKRDQLATKEDKIESMDANVDETREDKQELESKLDGLRELRADLESVRSDIDLQEESITSLKTERAELREEREALPDVPMDESEQLDQEISSLRRRKQKLEAKITDLQDVIQFNEEMLNGGESAIGTALAAGDNSYDTVTDQLIEDESIVCWTCGSSVERDRIDATMDTLRSVRQDYTDEISEIDHELEQLQADKREREQQQRDRERLDRKLDDITDELDQRESQLTDLREKRDQLSNDIEVTEEEVEALEHESFSEILDLHKEANQFEFELGQLESDLDDVTDQLSTIEDRLAEEESLTERRGQIQEDYEAQKSKIERIEREAVEEFNRHMEQILDVLEYENLARIWIERVQKSVREGRQKTEKAVFELHVVRTTESGATYEDTVDHLSESEREVTGLTFALAGYLVHDVHETVPFMLLDSLEAIDSERLANFISYFSDYARYLVVALLPEDAQALPNEYARITKI
ncbi:archaea-specific SMC-related protein [Natrinema gelatinilyticum]|uniref:archaea-specific SMC-related protein n=1 Tax=Natrinema gelatinilyticum TaxID=2961571 RepID=UPI0020C411AE|nr:archaea-specific SMC-related protein [Natrinema gelatinilyticum]